MEGGNMAREYFTVRMAADFMGISYSHFRKTVQPYFPPGEFAGRLVYRRDDLRAYMEQNTKWPHFESLKTDTGRSTTNSVGARAASARRATSDPLRGPTGSRRMMPRQLLQPKKQSLDSGEKSSPGKASLTLLSSDT
jgi:hypothetical protein